MVVPVSACSTLRLDVGCILRYICSGRLQTVANSRSARPLEETLTIAVPMLQAKLDRAAKCSARHGKLSIVLDAQRTLQLREYLGGSTALLEFCFSRRLSSSTCALDIFCFLV
ncbi:unnamed protein product [Ectocarpus sp. 12 AP-2014]